MKPESLPTGPSSKEQPRNGIILENGTWKPNDSSTIGTATRRHLSNDSSTNRKDEKTMSDFSPLPTEATSRPTYQNLKNSIHEFSSLECPSNVPSSQQLTTKSSTLSITIRKQSQKTTLNLSIRYEKP